MVATLVLDAMNMVGESLIWAIEEQALYWVDIGGKRIECFEPSNRRHRFWPTPDFPTSIGLRARGGFIVGLRRTVCFWTPGGTFETLVEPEPDVPDNRLNEGRVAPDGSFWVATMQNNLAPDGSPKEMNRDSGAYYRIGPDLTVTRLTAREYGITNTMAWLRDGRFLTADTTRNTIYAFDADLGAPAITNRRTFAGPIERGLPDGSCLDEADHLWNCRVVGGSALARFRPDGALDRLVDLPCSWPTSCTFGGPDLATLYVTSARFTMSASHVAANPQEGGLFALEPGVRGVPEHRFRRLIAVRLRARPRSVSRRAARR